MKNPIHGILLVLALATIEESNADLERLNEVFVRLNGDVIELRNELEQSIVGSRRCDSILTCEKTQYDECRSEYTADQFCPSFQQLGFAIDECGSGKRCNGLIDDTITTVRLPAPLATGPHGNPNSPEVIESVCSSRSAQRFMIDKYNDEREFWASLGVNSPQMFFGSSSGVFRIFPARHSRECNQYDPRTRPWYQSVLPEAVADSIKPRNLVIVMDTSRSMNETMSATSTRTKLQFMKASVKNIISPLSSQASIAVLRFGEFPVLVGQPGTLPPQMWQTLTPQYKSQLIQDIDAMDVTGRSNWHNALNETLATITNSLSHINATNGQTCELENIGILFFSDGEYNLPQGMQDEELVDFFASGVTRIESMGEGDYHIHTFFYSIGNTNVDQPAKKIACATDGYWIPADSSSLSSNVTRSYHTLFSFPMGTDAFMNYTRWSKPYIFTSSGKLGYTVSALAYDRSVQPARFAGAVGVDVTLEAAMKLYGGNEQETLLAMDELIKNFTEAFNTTCDQQRLDLTHCDRQSLRYTGGGTASICVSAKQEAAGYASVIKNTTQSNTTLFEEDLIKVEEKGDLDEGELFEKMLNCTDAFAVPCSGRDEYPTDLWHNVDLEDLDFEERVCCEVGTRTQSEVCPKLDEVENIRLTDVQIFGLIFGGVALVEVICCCYYCVRRKKSRLA